MSSFLLEIGVEELPARFIDPALEQMQELTKNILREQRIQYQEVKSYGTPRRLTVLVTDLAPAQEPLLREVKGPAAKVAYNEAGELTKAAQGFAKSQGVDVTQLVIKPVGPVDYVFAVQKDAGRPTEEILQEMCPAIINGLHFPKPMRWGNLSVRFARPVRWLVALYGNEIIEFEYAGLKPQNMSFGHRFLCKEPLLIQEPETYVDTMEAAYVMVDTQKRKKVIWEQVCAVAKEEGGYVEEDEELLQEVSNLLEWPTALCGSFEESFLRLPKEVLVTPMREHQRYFPVVDSSGALLPKFIAVKNGIATHLDIIRAGNEKVLRARLSDAAFFWDEDLKVPLHERVGELQKIVWQESLGSVYEKVERIQKLSQWLALNLKASAKELEWTKQAAWLCKADLVTSMVYEFTELQGIMGREYALRNGEAEAVAEAIFEHYLPRFAGDILPQSLPGRVLALADKMDSLVGCFGIGIQPTGSQDPYALRRQALGICHIVLEGNLSLSLQDFIACAYQGYQNLTKTKEEIIIALQEFFGQRLRGILTDKGFGYDTVEAVLGAGLDDIYSVVQRAEALAAFREEDSFQGLLTAFNRANNLAKGYTGDLTVDPALFETKAEEALYTTLVQGEEFVSKQLSVRDYQGILKTLETLQKPVDEFFETVMVMVDDPKVRDNRLALLKRIAILAAPVADLRKIMMA